MKDIQTHVCEVFNQICITGYGGQCLKEQIDIVINNQCGLWTLKIDRLFYVGGLVY